jgi:hypothetical protein
LTRARHTLYPQALSWRASPSSVADSPAVRPSSRALP